jgi:hypothetical protein
MKILLLSELLGRSDWFKFAETFSADLTAIAGDLLDGFSPAGFLPQAIALAHWTRRFPHARTIETLWREGQQLRREHSAPWLVLHHEPPADRPNNPQKDIQENSLCARIRRVHPPEISNPFIANEESH